MKKANKKREKNKIFTIMILPAKIKWVRWKAVKKSGVRKIAQHYLFSFNNNNNNTYICCDSLSLFHIHIYVVIYTHTHTIHIITITQLSNGNAYNFVLLPINAK